jgi:hypothetical protein
MGNPYIRPRETVPMKMRKKRQTHLHALAIFIVCLAGCRDAAEKPVELGVPGYAASKAALIASLNAWKANHRESGVIVGSNPAIGIVDATRTERSLLDYEVLGPLMVVQKARSFSVRLTLDTPPETVSARYLVMGRDPLWVFRQEDFERMIHWEHKMDNAPAATPQ